MRVLMVELQGRGGFWHYTTALSRALRQAGVEIALATTAPYEPLSGEVPVHVIGTSQERSSRARAGVRRAWSHGRRLAGLARVVESFRPDVVHLQEPIGRFDFLYASWFRARRARVVYTAHNPRPRTGAPGWLEAARHRSVDAIVTLSRRGVRDLIDDGVAPGKVAYIPHGNYLDLCPREIAHSDARRALGLPPSARIILFFGGIAPYKGLDVLIESFARVRAARPDANLVIAGPTRYSFAPYDALIERLGLNEVVTRRVGYVPLSEVPLYLSAADVVALPYRRSYQSGVLQLAYAFARPVVVSRTSDLGEQVLEDGTGLVAGLGPAEFGDALVRILNDSAQAASRGRRAQELARTKYSWEEIAQQSLAIYERLQAHASATTRGAVRKADAGEAM